jgi:hypothetical protein
VTDDAWRERALEDANRVVGLYGDPGMTWSIALEARLRTPVDRADVDRALADLAREAPALGPPAQLRVVDPGRFDAARDELVDAPFDRGSDVVRPLLSADGTRIVVVCHHGALDGLGMLAVLGRLTGTELRSNAVGVSALPATGFLRRSLGRLREAVLEPPQRFQAARTSPVGGDWVRYRRLDHGAGTAALLAAARHALEEWNAPAPARVRARPVSVAIGASTRASGAPHTPDRRTTYLRVARVPAGVSAAEARELVRGTPPEPDFPTTRGAGVGPIVTRLLSSRLGSSVLVSSLGRVDAEPRGVVESLAVLPATGGPNAVALGLATTGDTTMLTVRARRAAFGEADADRLADLVRDSLAGVDAQRNGRSAQ